MRYIGNTLKRRMDMLEINAATLAEMTFMDECLIRNIINNKIPYEKIDKFDMALICNLLDKALKRRFRNKVEFTKFNENEELKMIEKFVESIDLMEMDQELIEYTKGNHTQSETMDFLVEKLIQKVSKEVI